MCSNVHVSCYACRYNVRVMHKLIFSLWYKRPRQDYWVYIHVEGFLTSFHDFCMNLPSNHATPVIDPPVCRTHIPATTLCVLWQVPKPPNIVIAELHIYMYVEYKYWINLSVNAHIIWQCMFIYTDVVCRRLRFNFWLYIHVPYQFWLRKAVWYSTRESFDYEHWYIRIPKINLCISHILLVSSLPVVHIL